MISVLSDFLEVNPKSQIFDLEPILGGLVREMRIYDFMKEVIF